MTESGSPHTVFCRGCGLSLRGCSEERLKDRLCGGCEDQKHLYDRIDAATNLARQYGHIDGDHHKMWVIDQMVRALTKTPEAYAAWVREVRKGEDGPNTYGWDEGIPP